MNTHQHGFSRVTRRMIRFLTAGVWIGLISAGGPNLHCAPAVANSECMDCHAADDGAPAGEGVRPGFFAKSVHGDMSCVDCHDSIKEASHDMPLPKVQCATCHADIGATHTFHARLSLADIPTGKDTSCTECHGTHETVAIKSETFAFAPATQTASCGVCHESASKDFLASAHALPGDATPSCLSCHTKAIASTGDGGSLVELKLAQTRLCESCHVGNGEHGSRRALGGKFVASFDQSVHGAALAGGNGKAANCVDCHGAHEMNKAAISDALVNPIHITDTCAKCHATEAEEYRTSSHAIALLAGNLDSAGCTSCHGEHNIMQRADPASPVHKRNVSQQVCADCHASVRLSRKYGLSSDTFNTFHDSYHGLAVRGGSVEVVNCASCHGSHGIKSQDDPTSTIHKANLARTCGECHPGANARFAIGPVHSSVSSRETSPILYWIANIYVILIVVVIGGMVLHNLLDFLKKTRHKLDIQKGIVVEEHVEHRLYLRMTVHERIQHAILGISFTALVVTGFMLRYPEAWWVVGIRNLSSHAFELRSLGHRVAGVVMLALAAWHVGYLLFTVPGRSLLRDLLPRWRDFTDPGKVLRYNLGLRKERVLFPRFSYIEKMEYWAMVWGTFLMGVTGIILWFDNVSMGFITKLGFDISRTVHFYEAILATLAIIIWHFYWVIYNPSVYPMNLAWLTGRMSEQEMEEEHPLQLKAMKAAEARKQSEENQTSQPPASDSRSADGPG
ncbi:MAG TPA: cytochrome b/b6 domain-containing protein [Opitutaceae bacterium]|nr:cytochrome b/b6 domain-containing protein [Opitutaceae bacterium]